MASKGRNEEKMEEGNIRVRDGISVWGNGGGGHYLCGLRGRQSENKYSTVKQDVPNWAAMRYLSLCRVVCR